MAKIAVVGELNVDIIATGMDGLPVLGQENLAEDIHLCPGSSSGITASGLARLGNDVSFFGKVGIDEFGAFMLDELGGRGIDMSNVIRDSNIRTGITISLAVEGDRAMATYLGSIAALTIDDIDFTKLAGADHVHVASYYLQRGLHGSYRDLFTRAKESGLTTSLDTGWDDTEQWDDGIFETLDAVDVFLPNETETCHITKKADPREALDVLAEHVNVVAVKCGAKGSIVRWNGEFYQDGGFPIEPIDTTGAGDTFNAGFLHAYLSGWEQDRALAFANACGAMSALAPGGYAGQPSVDETEKFVGTRTT